jgi:hypothetical protein
MAFVASQSPPVAAPGKESRRSSGRFLPVLMAIFFAGGVLSAVGGFVLIVIHAAVPNKAVANLGTFLMIITIPLLLAGSHIMDVVDARKAAARQAEYHDRTNSEIL